ncbi:unnamed protein product, partial [Allacma fusca]
PRFLSPSIRPQHSNYLAPPTPRNDYLSYYELINPWPEGIPLPYPLWDQSLPDPVIFTDVIQYEDFAGLVELVSQKTVAGHNYNTVDNFLSSPTPIIYTTGYSLTFQTVVGTVIHMSTFMKEIVGAACK